MSKRFLIKNSLYFVIPLSLAVLAFFHPSIAGASTIPMTTGGDQIGQTIASSGGTVGGYATDGMYVAYGIAGLGVLTTIGEYFFMKEHKKAIHTTLGIAIAAGLGGAIMQAVSHGEAGNTAAAGAMISGVAHHAVLLANVHLRK